MSGPAANTETITLRRIILEKGNAFTYNGQDNNRLFFCGLVTTTAPAGSINNGDFIFGYLTTGDVIAGNPLTIINVYRYGSPDTESLGDCALSEDNNQLIGIFSTNHEKIRTFSEIGLVLGLPYNISTTTSYFSNYGNYDGCCGITNDGSYAVN